MNNWQEWVVGVLIVLCIARVIYGIYLFFRRTRESENPCDSCVSGIRRTDAVVIQEVSCLYLRYAKAHARMRLAKAPATVEDSGSETA